MMTLLALIVLIVLGAIFVRYVLPVVLLIGAGLIFIALIDALVGAL